MLSVICLYRRTNVPGVLSWPTTGDDPSRGPRRELQRAEEHVLLPLLLKKTLKKIVGQFHQHICKHWKEDHQDTTWYLSAIYSPPPFPPWIWSHFFPNWLLVPPVLLCAFLGYILLPPLVLLPFPSVHLHSFCPKHRRHGGQLLFNLQISPPQIWGNETDTFLPADATLCCLNCSLSEGEMPKVCPLHSRRDRTVPQQLRHTSPQKNIVETAMSVGHGEPRIARLPSRRFICSQLPRPRSQVHS